MRLAYNLKQAVQQLARNKGMTMASVFAITSMMLILGLFFVLTMNINLFTEMVKADYSEIEIFLLDDVSERQAQRMMDEIETFGGVKATTYRSKDEALAIMKVRFGDNGYLLDSLGDNPLPASILVTVDSLDSANSVTESARGMDGVEEVKYYRETVDKLTDVTRFIQIGAIVIMAFLVIVSVVVVSNTIKLTVFARSKEIEIMKYIGGTNWFIRGPFLVEGILIGIFSSAVSAGITYFIYKQIANLLGAQVMSILGMPMVPAGYLIQNLIIIFLAIGISIGASGSIISMRKFLDT